MAGYRHHSLHHRRALVLSCAMMNPPVNKFGILLVLALAGCAMPQFSTRESKLAAEQKDVEAIRQLAADWRSGWLAGDVELLLSLYAEDPVLMPQDHPVVVGKNAIRPLYESVLNEFDFQSEGTIEEVEVSGDLGYFWSTYALTATPKSGGDLLHVTGRSIFLVKRDPGGAWKITRLMDTSDSAATVEDTRSEGEPDNPATEHKPIR